MPPLDQQDLTGNRIASRRSTPKRPRLGFLGVGWIGRHRLQSVVRADIADVVVICDRAPDAVRAATAVAPHARTVTCLDELPVHELDGVVIATPSALHADEALAALARGQAVFCQKPLARTAVETRTIVDAARAADLLLDVDFCYRHVAGAGEMRQLIQSGGLGEVFAVDLTFHNAYGPDKAWYDEPLLAGGGCVIDLGIHLVDLAGWMTGEWRFQDVHSTLWRQGQRIEGLTQSAEDCAIAQWRQPNGATVRLACSWNLSAGQDAVIETRFYGTRGAVALRNLDGSFFRFVCEHYVGTQSRTIESAKAAVNNNGQGTAPAVGGKDLGVEAAGRNDTWDPWGAAALIRWARRLAEGCGFDEEIAHAVSVAELLDAIYGRQSGDVSLPRSHHHSDGPIATSAGSPDWLQ